MQLGDEPVLIFLRDADVARGLQAHDGVERGVGKVERPSVAPDDLHPARHLSLLDQCRPWRTCSRLMLTAVTRQP